MALIDFISDFKVSSLALIVPSVILVYFCLWLLFLDPLRRVPGPFITRISSIWLTYQSRRCRRSTKVDELHKRYGDVVRIAYNHVSINKPEALHEIYGNDREYYKGPWYDPYRGPETHLLGITNPVAHSELRKNLNPAFSARALQDFEPSMTSTYRRWKHQLLNQCSGKHSVELDIHEWANILAFDLIAEFSFGKSFGFVEKGYDYMDLANLMEKRLVTAAAIGTLPPSQRPFMFYVPFDDFWRSSAAALVKLKSATCEAYEDRKANAQANQKDLLSYMLSAKSEGGNSLPEELIIMQLTAMIVAGSDSTAASITSFVDFVSRDQELQRKIHEEIDTVFPGRQEADWIPAYRETTKLTFVQAVLYELFRIRPTAAIGFERYAANKDTIFDGHVIPKGTLVSVPTYSVHRNPVIFPNPDSFEPERWLAEDTSMQHKCFNMFSQGPRNCIGQNFAWMEILKSVTLLFKLFHFFRAIDGPSKMFDGFFYKLRTCEVKVELRK